MNESEAKTPRHKIAVDVLAKRREAESQGVHTATQSLIGLLKSLGEQRYKIYVDRNHKRSDVLIATAVYPRFYLLLKKKRKTVAMVHFLPETLDESIHLPKFLLDLYKRYVLSFYKRAKALVTVNPFFVEKLVDLGFERERVHAIPNYVSAETFHPLSVREKLSARKEFGIPDSAFVVMGCGQTQPRKGIQDFIAVAEDNPNMTFLWAGGFTFGRLTADYGPIKKMMSSPPPNVRFLGIVPNYRMNLLYNCADVFFMPSYDELFPMTLLEASNVNLPLLVRDLELYKPVLCGKALTGRDNIEFSTELKRLIKDPIYRAESAIKASELAEIYSAENVYSIWDDFLTQVAGRKGEKR